MCVTVSQLTAAVSLHLIETLTLSSWHGLPVGCTRAVFLCVNMPLPPRSAAGCAPTEASARVKTRAAKAKPAVGATALFAVCVMAALALCVLTRLEPSWPSWVSEIFRPWGALQAHLAA